MPIPEISIHQFNKIASGEYNAGFVDFATDADGNVLNDLKKVNHHVVRTGLNRKELSTERILEVKEAFIGALERARVPQDRIDRIRETLGIPKEMAATGDAAQLKKILEARFKPLARQHIRALLDKYAAGGIGFVPGAARNYTAADFAAAHKAGHMSKSRTKDRQAVNRANADVAHNTFGAAYAEGARASLATLRAALQAAGGDAGRKAAALRAFADAFAEVEGKMLRLFDANLRTPPAKTPPTAFAGAITDVLFDNFTVLKDALGFVDGLAMYGNVHNIVNNELHVQVGYRDSDGLVDAIKQNAQEVRGDKDYAIDIGV